MGAATGSTVSIPSMRSATGINMRPNEAKIKQIYLNKYNNWLAGNNDQRISLMPQFVELSLYQSVTQPCMRGNLLLYDAINLFSHYPMIGEEIIEFIYEGTGISAGKTDMDYNLVFMVASVTGIEPDDKLRAYSYAVELYSIEMYENARRGLQCAFRSEYHEIMKNILRNHLLVDEKKIVDENFEETLGIVHVVVPNMHPFEAIQWMVARAVPKGTDDRILFFYETPDGYNLRSYEKVMRDPSSHKFVYISNMLQPFREQILKAENIYDRQVITALQVNKRYNSIERIMGGYFESEYFDIDIFNRKVVSTPALLNPLEGSKDKKYPMNTPQFIQSMQNNNDTVGQFNRTRYVVSQDEGDEAGSPNNWKNKFSFGAQLLVAMNQTAISLALPGDTTVRAGDKVKILLPEVHGFNIVNEDRYISGDFFVTDVKHLFSVGGFHSMAVNLARDRYEQEIAQNHEYKFQ